MQKAGTSWWFTLLCEHPMTQCDPDLKELHFFDRFWAQPFVAADVDGYHAHFDAPPDRCTGEWTPRYLFDPWTPPLLARTAPDARILVLLRDPVQRYVSGLTHALRYDGAPLDGPRRDRPRFARGCYGQQLQRLLASYPASQVLVQQYEACADAPARELQRTYGFLGLDPDVVPTNLLEPVLSTTGDKAPLPEAMAAALTEAYLPDLELLARLAPDLDLDRWPSARRLG